MLSYGELWIFMVSRSSLLGECMDYKVLCGKISC